MCPLIRIHCSLSWTVCLCVICIFYLALYSFIHFSVSLNLIFPLCNKDSILLVNRSLLFFCGQMLHSSLSNMNCQQIKTLINVLINSHQGPLFLYFQTFSVFLVIYSFVIGNLSGILYTIFLFIFLVKVWKTAVRFFCAWNECCQMQGLG